MDLPKKAHSEIIGNASVSNVYPTQSDCNNFVCQKIQKNGMQRKWRKNFLLRSGIMVVVVVVVVAVVVVAVLFLPWIT